MTRAFANITSAGANTAHSSTAIELICPAATMVQLRAAVDNGADCIQLQFSKRNECGGADKNINFKAITSGIRYARDRFCKVSVRIDTNATPVSWTWWRDTISRAASLGVQAVELSDPALLFYAAAHYPQLELHYAPAEIAINADTIEFYRRQFNISRVTLPRILSTAQLIGISQGTSVGLQLNGFCRFSSSIDSTRLRAAAVEKRTVKRKFAEQESAPCTGLCAAMENASNDDSFNAREKADIKVLRLLPQLNALGVRAIRVEASTSYPSALAQATRVWREAIDECAENIDRYAVKPAWIAELNDVVCRLQNS